MDDLNESQCEKLDQILSLFVDKDSLEADKVLTIEGNELKANALIDMLVRRRFVSTVGEVIGRVLPLILNLNPNAKLFINNGGFFAEFKKQQTKYSFEPTVINIHTNGHGNTINTGNHASLTTQSTVASKESDPDSGPLSGSRPAL